MSKYYVTNTDDVRWAVIDTDTDACVCNNLSEDSADRLIEELRQDGRDCYMEPAR